MTKKVTDEILKEMVVLRGMNYSYSDIAKYFNLGRSTIYRYLTPEKNDRRRDRKKKYNKKYRKENKEQLRIANKKWRQENPERNKENHKKWRENNPEKWGEITRRGMRNFYKRNPERVNEIQRKYYKTLKGKAFNNRHNNKRRSKFPVKLNTKDLAYIKERDKNCCVYCPSNNDLTLDHIDPNGSTTVDNLVLACRSCNSKKRDKNVFEFCKLMKIDVPEIIINITKL